MMSWKSATAAVQNLVYLDVAFGDIDVPIGGLIFIFMSMPTFMIFCPRTPRLLGCRRGSAEGRRLRDLCPGASGALPYPAQR